MDQLFYNIFNCCFWIGLSFAFLNGECYHFTAELYRRGDVGGKKWHRDPGYITLVDDHLVQKGRMGTFYFYFAFLPVVKTFRR